MRRPRGGDERSSPTRAAPGPRPGILRSPARSSLTAVGSAGRVGSPFHPWRVAAAKDRKARQELSRKRGPAPEGERRDGAPRGARILRKRMRQDGRLVRRSVLHPLAFCGERNNDDGLPGAAKNTGDEARLFVIPGREQSERTRNPETQAESEPLDSGSGAKAPSRNDEEIGCLKIESAKCAQRRDCAPHRITFISV